MIRLISVLLYVFIAVALGSCGKKTDETAVSPQQDQDVQILDGAVSISPSTVADKLLALRELGIGTDASGLGDPIRLDPQHPSLGGINNGNYMTLVDTTHSIHTYGGFVTLLPPYERTLLGETSVRVPRVILRLDSKNFVRLVDCGGNGPSILKFTLRQGVTPSNILTESVVTSSNGHWYFAIPASLLTGFPNSMYLTISQDPDNPATSLPIDVRFTGCDITPVN